jgi:uncharacterized protein (TIRG00374 family)
LGAVLPVKPAGESTTNEESALSQEGNTQATVAEPFSGKRKKTTWWRWIISLAIFFFVLQSVDLRGFQTSLSHLRWGTLLSGFVLLAIAIILSRAVRLWLFLKTQESSLSLWETTQIHWTSAFLGLLVPGTLGVDASRIWAVSRSHGRMEPAIAAVTMDRIAGFLGIIANAILAWVFFGGVLIHPKAGGIVLDAGLFSLALLVVLGLLSSPRFTSALTRLPVLRAGRIRSVISGLQEGLLRFRQNPRKLTVIMVVSTVGHLFNILAVFVLARGLGVDLGFGYFMALIPLSLVVTGLPISFLGLGVRDLTYVSLFRPLGVPEEIMLAVSVAEFGMTALLRLMGGLVFLFSKKDAATELSRPR